MPFDQSTRNRLARFVADARALLTQEFTRQLQNDFGLDPERGAVTELSRLGHLDDQRRSTARILRATLDHYLAGNPKPTAKARQEALERIVREQAFTVLNRLAALRMAEARGLLIESVGQGYRSKGFQLYARLAGPALGETGDAYRSYLFSLFDEFAVDLAVLFDRFSPQGRLFPREAALLQLLETINHPEIDPLWAEDETIGWIYQYFNSQEERRQMRAESQAPRNSHELAVRNQFFTPRYVVEFLTDNTLGRIWYEMTKGQTGLVESCRYLVRRPNEIFLGEGEEASSEQLAVNSGEDLSQEELLRQPVYIPHRPLKDPRQLRMLDPACGSMHFGLYAFDLYERIYEEAWELAVNPQSPNHLITNPLLTDYPTKESLLRAIPRLIIEHNIHGIDIDPRAVQIAGLSLWLRAQRSWKEQALPARERPVIRRSHIVCAEPMPGDRALLEEFLAELREDRLESLIRQVIGVAENQRVRATPSMADALAGLVRTVWAEMELAGEAGSLLKIEGSLADAIERGRSEWDEKLPLFRVETFRMTDGAAETSPKVNYPRSLPDGADFWERAEGLVLAALEAYAERAENGRSYARRLFAGDAARGFAFIDLCRQRYDVVLMNPPFGACSTLAKATLVSLFPQSKHDIFSMFIQRWLIPLTPDGLLGAITSRTGFFLASFRDWREEIIIRSAKPITVADLGYGVLDDAMVETAAYCLSRRSVDSSIFIGLLNDSEKEDSLASAINSLMSVSTDQRLYCINVNRFGNLPNTSFSYWATPNVIRSFSILPSLEADGRIVRVSNETGDDFRFMRLWTEIPPIQVGRSKKWVPHAKGGPYRHFSYDLHLMIAWADNRKTVRGYCGRPARPDERVACSDLFFRPGVTYPRRTNRFSARALPSGSVFSNKGAAILVVDDDPTILHAIVALTNSAPFIGLLQLQTAAGHLAQSFEVGLLQRTPIPELHPESILELASLGKRAFRLSVSNDIYDEFTHSFVLPGITRHQQQNSLSESFDRLSSVVAENISATEDMHKQIDGLVAGQYGFSVSDTVTLTKPFNIVGSDEITEEEDDTFHSSIEVVDTIIDLVSYIFGTISGRWDIRLATGAKTPPELPDPFAPLPVCPPGMLQNADGLPAAPSDVPADYPLRISWPGILVDDPGHPEDIEGRVREALQVIWPQNADAIEEEACQILGVDSLRAWFANPNAFFDDHLKRYSKSRRAAPIYWPLSTPSGSYTLWLYYHRLTDQSLYACVNDFVEPKLKVVSEQLAVIRRKGNRSGQEERELERLGDVERELDDLRAELLRIARFWRPNLNDGVQITAAPLWRLFRHRGWSKRLQETWETLEAGEYDWAHLAMSIWPARVVPQCVADRSLAIAHDLENLFWVEDGGTWRNLRSPAEELADQKQRHRSPVRQRVAALLGDLAQRRGQARTAAQVYAHLAGGDWDDLPLARLLWPARAAEKCWNDPLLAMDWRVTLPGKATKKAQRDFTAQMESAGCPEVAELLADVLAEDDTPFPALWSRLAGGQQDDAPLALALWPERVLEKCLVDAALAGVHGMRGFFWVEGAEGVWRRRVEPSREVADEVGRRG